MDQYSDVLNKLEAENEQLKKLLKQKSHGKDEFESRMFRLNDLLQAKDIEISELKTSINTYYNDLMKEK